MGAKDKKNLGIHFGLVLAEVVCVAGFAVELSRALSGNTLSWAYVFEWPIFAAYALYMWQKLLREARGVTRRGRPGVEDDGDALDAYNEYLRGVHSPGADSRPKASHQAQVQRDKIFSP